MIAALLGPSTPDALRRSLDGYTADGVHDPLGPVGRAAQDGSSERRLRSESDELAKPFGAGPGGAR